MEDKDKAWEIFKENETLLWGEKYAYILILAGDEG